MFRVAYIHRTQDVYMHEPLSGYRVLKKYLKQNSEGFYFLRFGNQNALREQGRIRRELSVIKVCESAGGFAPSRSPLYSGEGKSPSVRCRGCRVSSAVSCEAPINPTCRHNVFDPSRYRGWSRRSQQGSGGDEKRLVFFPEGRSPFEVG